MAADEEHDGASVKELLIEACRRNNTELLNDIIAGKPDAEVSRLLNATTTVMGNHLYHEAASRGHYEVIDLLLDQHEFECDPINRLDGDTPLHAAVRWINGEPWEQREFGTALVEMMLEAGSSTRVRNKARLTPAQLVDPTNPDLREVIQQHEYASQNRGDFIPAEEAPAAASKEVNHDHRDHYAAPVEDDDHAEFSGSDEDERAEWERRRKDKKR